MTYLSLFFGAVWLVAAALVWAADVPWFFAVPCLAAGLANLECFFLRWARGY